MVVHPAGEALVEVPRGRVERAVEGLPVALQQVAGVGGDPLVDVDRLEAAARAQGEPDLCGSGGHLRQPVFLPQVGTRLAFPPGIPYHSAPASRLLRAGSKEAHPMLRRVLPGLLAGAVLAVPASAQTVDEVIARSFEARGGLDRLRAIQAIRVTGRMSMGADQASMVVERKRPGQHPCRDHGPGRSVPCRPGTASPRGGSPPMGSGQPEVLPAEAASAMAAEADVDGPLVDYQAKGHRVAAPREGDAGGRRRLQDRGPEEGRRRRGPLPRRPVLPDRCGSRASGRSGER